MLQLDWHTNICWSPAFSSFEVELLDHMVIVYLIFGGTAILFSTSAIPFYTPTSNAQGEPSILTSPVAYQPLAETVF